MSKPTPGSFARLYGEGYDQVLALMDDDGDLAPQVTLYFSHEGLGACHIRMSWPNKGSVDEQRVLAEQAFEKLDEDTARKIVRANLAVALGQAVAP